VEVTAFINIFFLLGEYLKNLKNIGKYIFDILKSGKMILWL